MIMYALDIQNFRKTYGEKVAVNGINLTVKEGEFFGFLGPNGAGKTTTIHCITGVGKFTEGTIKIFGKDVVKDYRDARRMVGLSPQEFNVDIFAPVNKILWYMGGFYGVPKPERKKRVEELLNKFDLARFAKTPFRELSGGYKRRVMLARAMVHDPKLLILDEPTAGVDVEQRLELWKYLQELNAQGKTILLTSHYLEEVEKLCQRIAIIHQGNLVAVGDKGEFVSADKNLEKRYLELTSK